MMDLKEAIEEVKRSSHAVTDVGQYIQDGWSDTVATAIATILNAVVKGELK